MHHDEQYCSWQFQSYSFLTSPPPPEVLGTFSQWPMNFSQQLSYPQHHQLSSMDQLSGSVAFGHLLLLNKFRCHLWEKPFWMGHSPHWLQSVWYLRAPATERQIAVLFITVKFGKQFQCSRTNRCVDTCMHQQNTTNSAISKDQSKLAYLTVTCPTLNCHFIIYTPNSEMGSQNLHT